MRQLVPEGFDLAGKAQRSVFQFFQTGTVVIENLLAPLLNNVSSKQFLKLLLLGRRKLVHFFDHLCEVLTHILEIISPIAFSNATLPPAPSQLFRPPWC